MTRTDLNMTERIFWDWHKRIHGKGTGYAGSWNDRWDTFFRKNQNPTREEVFRYMRQLQSEFGL